MKALKPKELCDALQLSEYCPAFLQEEYVKKSCQELADHERFLLGARRVSGVKLKIMWAVTAVR